MDQAQLQKQIAEYYSKLPSDIQQVFASMAWMETLRSISTKYGLNESQIETLGTETTLALLGIIHPDEYEKNLTEELGTMLSFTNMMTEINDSVFKSLRPQLAEVYAGYVEPEKSESPIAVGNIDPRFSVLPVEVQNAIAVSDYQKKLYEIGSEYELPINKMASLEEITVKFITASISPTQYESELALETDLPADKVSEIATKVNEQILKKIRETMQGKVSSSSIDDEVPVPPYAEKVTSPIIGTFIPTKEEVAVTPNTISKTEADIYGNAGIEVIDGTEDNEESQLLVDTNTDMFANKLNKMVMSKNSVSDYSLPKINKESPAQPQAKSEPAQSQVVHDPYHEPIN